MATLPVVPPNIDDPAKRGAAPRAGDGYSGPSFGAPASVREGRRDDEKQLVREASARGLTKERRDAVRQKALAEIPWWYSPHAHLAATTGIGLAVLVASVVSLARLEVGVRWTDLLVIPAVVLLANYYEWRVHKDVLHKRFWPFEVIYDKHTPMHHMIYVEDDMAVRDVKEFRLVLIPAAGVLGIVLAAAPVAIGLAHFWSAAAGWLFLLSASLFMVVYEVLHLCYHAPADSFIGRQALIRVLRAHHARHHDPRLMQRYNFNVTVPLFDWIMGTMAPERDDAGRGGSGDGSGERARNEAA
ncbi:MAG: sterol desaturase family protein [Labilithrix sp.]|nr:sterol desaturase family protein [Labilithrix sp.]